MDSIVRWYRNNYIEITWFIVGWMAMALLVDFSNGNWTGCLLDIFLIVVNVYFVKK
jgi:hypothetical protein